MTESAYDIPMGEHEHMPLSPEVFYDHKNWGVKSGFTRDEFLAFCSAAEAEYETNTEGHNFEHAMTTLWLVNEVVDEYESAGSQEGRLNRKLANCAAILHDIGKYSDFVASDFDTEEQFSAYLAGVILEDFGINGRDKTDVQEGILSTGVDGVLDTPLKKALGIADMHNVGEARASFKARGKSFLAEAHRRQGESFDIVKYKIGTMLVLAAQLSKDFTLSGVKTRLGAQAKTNFQGMIEEFTEEQPECLHDALKSAGGTLLRRFVPEHLRKRFLDNEDDDQPTRAD